MTYKLRIDRLAVAALGLTAVWAQLIRPILPADLYATPGSRCEVLLIVCGLAALALLASLDEHFPGGEP